MKGSFIHSIFIILISSLFFISGCTNNNYESNIEDNGEILEKEDSILYDGIDTQNDKYVKSASNDEIIISDEMKMMLSKSFEKNMKVCGGVLPSKKI